MRYFLLIAVLLNFGCNYSKENKSLAKSESESTNAKPLNKPVSFSNPTKNKKKTVDSVSINLNTMLNDALTYALKHQKDSSYKIKLNKWSFPYTSQAIISFGHIFSTQKKHLIVKRMLWGSTIAIDVFLYKNAQFNTVCSSVLEENTFVQTEIKDVNGDIQKDFLINWYPSSGCCLRNIYDVYLYNKQTGGFSNKYKFINPTFSASEKVIRGIDYGQPGDVGLYKYKWKRLKIDTIEILFPDTIKKGYQRYKSWNDLYEKTNGNFLVSIPKEYRKVQGYNWFRGIY